MFASHAINHGRLVCPHLLRHRFHQGLIPRGPAFRVPENMEKTRIPPRTFTHAWAIIPSLLGIDSNAPSYLPITAARLVSTATNTPSDVCLRSSPLAFSSVILTASAADLHPCLALLLKCSSLLFFPHSVFNSEENISSTCVPSHVLLLSAPRRPIP